MFTESEVDPKTDFVPNELWDGNFFSYCFKRCRNYTDCPCFYECPTMIRWKNADMDNDNSNI